MAKLKVAFFGTPDFSVPSLDILFNHPEVELKYVISMPDRKAGRGYNLKSPEVIEFAKEKRIPFFQTDNINKELDFLEKLEQEKIDCFIVLAFAQFLSQKVLDIPSKGCFNIHTSLLPKYRGAAPIQYAILNGDTSTGVSIQKMVKKMDAGDIVLSHPVAIEKNETGGQLYTKLKFQAALSLNNFLYDVTNGKVSYAPQNEDEVSFAPTLKRDDGLLNFEDMSSEKVLNTVRGLYPWPGTFCFLGKKRLKILEVSTSPLKLNPGEISTQDSQLIIGCKEKSIHIKVLQLEGKKMCSDRELLNGLKDKSEIQINPK